MTKFALSLIFAAVVGRAQYINGSRTIEGPVNFCSDSGASDAYACSFTPAIAAYQTGTVYTFKANTANTGAATVNFNALGAKTIRKRSDQDLADNDIKAGQLVQMVYDGTYMQMLSQVANAAAGGAGNITLPLYFPAAHCDLGAASTGFRRPTSNFPEPLCVIGTNTIGAVLAFDPSTDESMQVPMLFPTSASAINVRFTWRSIATSGSVVWGIQTTCIGVGETADPAFNVAQTVTDAANGTTLTDNDATISSLTATGCSANEQLRLRIFRDADNGSDTMTGDAWLSSVVIEIVRSL